MIRFFDHIIRENENLFYKVPLSIPRTCDRETLSHALGATLYVPASRSDFSKKIIDRDFPDLKSMVICFEDAIGGSEVESSGALTRENLHAILHAIDKGRLDFEELPHLFIRVRDTVHLEKMLPLLSTFEKIITGFVLPKINSENAPLYFEKINSINHLIDKTFYVMPILESPLILYKETRMHELEALRKIFSKYRNLILNLRIGGTDFSSCFGLRRQKHHSIYDLLPVQSCMADIINFFMREEEDYVISGPVWEYFQSSKVETPMHIQDLHAHSKGLCNELLMDKSNGLLGKTVIHPSQIPYVHACYLVEYEEYMDALSILSTDASEKGVIKSEFSNKMNEIKPHVKWAKKIMKRSKIYGVLNHGYDYLSVLSI